jgi:hypothetical protein
MCPNPTNPIFIVGIPSFTLDQKPDKTVLPIEHPLSTKMWAQKIMAASCIRRTMIGEHGGFLNDTTT